MKRLKCTYRIYENIIEIIPHEGLKNNSLYNLKIKNIKSETGNYEISNFNFDLVTKMEPCYCTIDDVNVLISGLEVTDDIILYCIRNASREADFVNQGPIEKEMGYYPFEVSKFVAIKAAIMIVRRAYMVGAGNAGLEGTLGKISFKNGTQLSSLKTIIDDLTKEAKVWQDAIRGYILEGRNKSRFALRGNRTIKGTPAKTILKDFTRNVNMGDRI